MSIEFDSNTDYCRINPAGAVSHYAFTLIAKVRITSAAAGDVLSVYTNTTHVHALKVDAAGTAFTISRNYDTDTAAVATAALDTWHSVAIGGWLSGATRKLSGYVKTDAGALQKATVDNPQFGDTLTYVSLGAGSSGDYPRGLLAYAKFYGRALSDAEIEAEMVAEAPVSLTDLISYTTGQGGNITAAMTANTSNAAYADTWTAYDFANAAGTTPTYDADAPTWAAAGPTLSGSVAMTDAEPSVGIAVAAFAINSSNNEAAVTATFSALPTVGRPLVAFVGGRMDSATEIALSDSRDADWELLGLLQVPGSSRWVGAWRSVMPAGTTADMAVTATPDVATGNWLTLIVCQVANGYSARLFDVLYTEGDDTDDAPTVDLANTTNTPALVLGAATYASAANAITAGTGWTAVATQDGAAALSVVKRVAATAGAYDPAWTLADADAWGAIGFALVEDPPDSAVYVTVTPATATLVQGQTQQLTAVHSTNGAATFTWSIVSGLGTVSASGLYTAPASDTVAIIKAAYTTTASYYDTAVITVSGSGVGTTTVTTTWVFSGVAFASQSLDYVVKSSDNTIIASGTQATNGSGELVLTIDASYSGQKVIVHVENVGAAMTTSGKVHGTQVATAA